ncbi:MAG: DUF748 domain-containing protein [Burkholderiaceae bacterium]|nr:DUF748 domain-containing protein [Burkholderiaceae bacterium]
MTPNSLLNNTWVRRAAWTIGGIGALWLLAWAGVPPLLKHQLERIGSEQLGRKVTVGAVDFKPWSLELTLNELAVATADGQSDQLRIVRIYVNASAQSLLRLAPVLDTLSVDAPALRLAYLGDGRYDVDDIVQKLAADSGEPPGEPAKFALYNIALSGGTVDFDDRSVGKVHTLRDLQVAVPFLSNLDSKRDVHTDPLLAFTLNGSRFDSGARTTPFAETRKTDATLKISALDLTPYAAYIPASIPVRLVSAVLDADLKVAFEQTPKPYSHLSGTVTATGVKLQDDRQRDLLAFERLQVNLAQARLLERKVQIASLELTAPVLDVRRAADGSLNLLAMAGTAPPSATATSKATAGTKAAASAPLARNSASAPAPSASVSENTSKTIAEKDRSTLGSGKNIAKKTDSGSWGVTLEKLTVRGARVNWSDAATGNAAPALLVLRDGSLDASGIQTPVGDADIAAIPFSGSATLAQGEPGSAPAGEAAGATDAAADSKGTQRGAASSKGSKARVARAKADGKASGRPAAKTAAGGSRPALAPATLQFTGLASTRSASVTATIGALPLSFGAPYLATYLEPTLAGTLDADFALNWRAATAEGASDALAVTLERVALSRVSLTRGKDAWVAVQDVELNNARIDLTQRSATVGKLVVGKPRVELSRAADGRWRLQEWLKEAKVVRSERKAEAAAGKAGAVAPWKLAVDDLQISGGVLDWRDDTTAQPVAVDLTDLQLQLRQFVLGGKKPATLQVAARLGAAGGPPGRLSYKGTVGTEPARAQGALELVRLPVDAFEAYFGDALNIDLLNAAASFKGSVDFADTPAGPRARVSGDTRIDDFKADSVRGTAVAGGGTPTQAVAPAAARASARAVGSNRVAGAEEALAWRALELRGVDVALAPGVTTTVAVKETALSDFYARVILSENGRLNLQDIVKSSPPAGSATTAATVASSAGAGGAKNASVSVAKSDQKTLADGKKDTKPGPEAPRGGDSGVRIDVGPISLTGGRVYFSDRFIKPNYSADLTELTGRLGGFSSVAATGSPQMADLELRGKAAGTGSLEILGKVNPLAQPLALDIKGKVRDLELPPLSPYSIKYAGHGIERGKLSVDVGYLVRPDGQLTASHQIVLNQLKFGDPVEGAPASLPVRLAVALLADRNGVIDINLPVSGSLNDPQFSLGGVILKIIGNLIVKAITAPFSLLASAFGGGDELSNVSFAPGSAALSPQAREGLNKVAKALTDRPALKMTVVGTSSLEVERDAYKRERLQALVVAEKRRAAGDAAKGTATVTVSAAEYPELLKAVYKRADFPKPRNLVGLAKDIPQAEMEALLLANISVTAETMRELATQRGTVVRDYLAAQQLPLDRLFLGAPRAGAEKPGAAPPATNGAPAAGVASPSSGAPWSPRAELSLSTG